MERRQQKRISNLGFIESYSFQGENREVEIKRPVVISLKDISMGGLGISSSKPFEVGLTLSLDLQVNDENFVVIGKIVWCRREEDNYECGLKLIYMPENLSRIIESYESKEHRSYIN